MGEEARVARAEVRVPLSPAAAFDVFTAGIGGWWRGYWNDERAVSIRLEPGVGGRLVEVWDPATGEGFEIGRVTAWEPGRRVAFSWRESGWEPDESTEVGVGFEPAEGATRVTLAHGGWESVAGDPYAGEGYAEGWEELLGWYAEAAAEAAS